MKLPIKKLITDKITGEWGNESSDGKGCKVLRTTNFTNIGVIDFENVVVRDIDEKKVTQKHLKFGDIIIEKSGGSPKQPVGRVVFFEVDNNEKFLCNNFTSTLRPDSSKVIPKYLFYQLYQLHNRGKTLKYQNKTTGIINLKLDNYLEEEIEVPSFETQLHIANILSKAESLIAQRKESIRLLDEYLKSVFLEMFGDPVRNEKGWGTKTLIEVCSKIGSGATPRGGKEAYKNEGISLIRSMNVYNDEFVFKDLAFIDDLQASDLNNVTIEEEDVLLNITGASVARCCIVPKTLLPARVNQHVSIIRPNPQILAPIFLSRTITNSNYQTKLIKDSKSKGATREAITKDEIEKMTVIVPPLELQTQFALIVEKAEALKVQYQQSLQELENLYGSLSQKAFKGELMLKDEGLLGHAEQSQRIAAEPETKYYTSNPILYEKDCSQPERAILAAYILNLFEKQDIGRVHLMKLLHLTEYHCQINIHSHFIQKAAGPYDYELIKDIEQYFIRYKLYRVIQDKTEMRKVHYTQISPNSVVSELFYDNFRDQAIRINQLLEKFKNWSMVDCEVASTLYAVWNNRIIRRQSVDYSALKQDFLEWSTRKKSIINRFDSIYNWMLENNVIPGGYGDIILKVA